MDRQHQGEGMSPVRGDDEAARVVILRDARSVEGFEAALQDAAYVQTLRRVAATVMHDFKSPLQSAVWAVELLERGIVQGESASEQHAYLATLKKELARLKNASQNVLDGLAPAERERTDIVGLIEELTRFVRAEAMLSDVAVVLALPREEVVVEGRRSRLGAALLTLMMSAMDAMPEGGKLTIELERIRDSIELSINETGSSSGETPERSFELDFSTGSHGIGLHVARSVVRAEGGEIEWGRSPVGGSSFRIRLPAAS
jgi:signal transduction histidine kinase